MNFELLHQGKCPHCQSDLKIDDDDCYRFICGTCDFTVSADVMFDKFHVGLSIINRRSRPDPPPWPGYTPEMFMAIMNGTDTPEMWKEQEIRCTEAKKEMPEADHGE